MACVSPLTPKSLSWCEGKTSQPGIRKKVYFVPKRAIVSWPTFTAKPTDAATIATYTGKFTLAAEAKWMAIEVNQKKSPVSCEQQGEKPCCTFLNKATFVHNGTEEEATAFASLAKNDDYVYLFQTPGGQFRVIGNDVYETDTKTNLNLGQVGGTEKGTTIEVSCTDEIPAPFYTGEIVTEDGTINPESPGA